MALTLVSSFGFFLRDLLMARQSGFSDDLDAFFVALMIPMFFVTVLAMPIGAAMTPTFLRIRESVSGAAAQALVSRISRATLLSSFVLAAVLYVLAMALLPYLASGFSPLKLARATTLTYWALPLMLVSGLVIMGNALLNALQHFSLPAWAQAVVPVFTIAALLMFGPQLGAVAALAGMLAGQMVNLAMVSLALTRLGLSLQPFGDSKASPPTSLKNFRALYLPLVAGALFSALAIPAGNISAANLSSGSIATLTLGNKIVLFICTVLLNMALSQHLRTFREICHGNWIGKAI